MCQCMCVRAREKQQFIASIRFYLHNEPCSAEHVPPIMGGAWRCAIEANAYVGVDICKAFIGEIRMRTKWADGTTNRQQRTHITTTRKKLKKYIYSLANLRVESKRVCVSKRLLWEACRLVGRATVCAHKAMTNRRASSYWPPTN